MYLFPATLSFVLVSPSQQPILFSSWIQISSPEPQQPQLLEALAIKYLKTPSASDFESCSKACDDAGSYCKRWEHKVVILKPFKSLVMLILIFAPEPQPQL